MVGQRHKSRLKMTSNGLNDESLIKIYNEESYEGYFVEFDVHHPEKHLWPSQWFIIFTWKNEKVERLYMIQPNMSFT